MATSSTSGSSSTNDVNYGATDLVNETPQLPATIRTSSARSFKGGFSTSIVNGMFERPGDVHTDCCALTCCGLLLYDRNLWLLSETRPSWKHRCCQFVCFIVLVFTWFLVMLLLGSMAAAEKEDADDDDNDTTMSNHKNAQYPSDSPEQALLSKIFLLASAFIVGFILYDLRQAAHHRFLFRRSLMRRLYYQESNNARVSSQNNPARHDSATASATPLINSVESYLQGQDRYILSATRACGCVGFDHNGDETAHSIALENKGVCGTDLCYNLWKGFSGLFCGALCKCWCQCCGLCAMAQEARELQRMLPKHQLQIDYITFQPFTDYAPQLQALRDEKINNPFIHMTTLSLLSKHLIQIFGAVVGILTILAVSGVDPIFRVNNLMVFLLAFVQAFVIIFLVHWLFNRFDLSFDAVVKYFASGFLLCTANALFYEVVVSNAMGILTWVLVFGIRVVYTLLLVVTGKLDDMPPDETANLQQPSKSLFMDYLVGVAHGDSIPSPPSLPVWWLAISAFLNAFVVAATVEELCKYFGYWMVEHPDLQLPESQSANRLDATEIGSGSGEDQLQSTSKRTLKSLGAGITVAMVTTAVGFACCENLVYVFVYTPSNSTMELTTMIARSIFPVHPIAAALQSIGVCKRDVEKDKAVGLGRILLPALLLHGTFDFALMFLDLLTKQSSASDEDGGETQEDERSTAPDGEVTSAMVQSFAMSVILSVAIVLLSVAYYVIAARAQRRRLDELDSRLNGYEQLQ